MIIVEADARLGDFGVCAIVAARELLDVVEDALSKQTAFEDAVDALTEVGTNQRFQLPAELVVPARSVPGFLIVGLLLEVLSHHLVRNTAIRDCAWDWFILRVEDMKVGSFVDVAEWRAGIVVPDELLAIGADVLLLERLKRRAGDVIELARHGGG